MSTEPFYFSVDVETSGLTLGEGKLLSIGAVVVSHDGWIIDTFYRRVRAPLTPSWFCPPHAQDTSTQKFWKDTDKVGDFARSEAYLDLDIKRVPVGLAAEEMHDWVMQYGDTWEDRIFVANPVSFDFMWTVDMFERGGMPNPFHYRTLCLRSMAFGQSDRSEWHANHLRTHRPKHPHHALSDAFAQAQDLIHLMGKADQLDPLDEPHYEYEPKDS